MTQHRTLFLMKSRRATSRRGSVLLLCTLATVMLSLAGIAILRTHKQHIAATHAAESSVEARMTTDGLMQRAIAQLRNDPHSPSLIQDKGSTMPEAFAKLQPISGTLSEVQVFLYQGSTTPALKRRIDTDTL